MLCFLCGHNITTIKCSQPLKRSNVKISRLIIDIIGTACQVNIGNEDEICETCTVLLEDFYDYRIKVKFLQKLLQRQVNRTYHLSTKPLPKFDLDHRAQRFFSQTDQNEYKCKHCAYQTQIGENIATHFLFHNRGYDISSDELESEEDGDKNSLIKPESLIQQVATSDELETKQQFMNNINRIKTETNDEIGNEESAGMIENPETTLEKVALTVNTSKSNHLENDEITTNDIPITRQLLMNEIFELNTETKTEIEILKPFEIIENSDKAIEKKSLIKTTEIEHLETDKITSSIEYIFEQKLFNKESAKLLENQEVGSEREVLTIENENRTIPELKQELQSDAEEENIRVLEYCEMSIKKEHEKHKNDIIEQIETLDECIAETAEQTSITFCTQCSESFPNLNTLIEHMKLIHTHCMICNKTHKEKNSVNRHFRDFHDGDMEMETNDQDNIHKINEEAELIALDLLPKKSAEVYLRSYEKFMEWKKEQNINEKCISESVMLAYFKNIKAKYKPSSMWVEYSMLKTMIARNHNVDVKYPRLITFLKENFVGFRPKKSNIFQPDDIQKFLCDADDTNFLAMKMIMIFGVYGVTSADKLTKVDVNDVREEGNVFIIKIPETKTNVVRTFTVEDECAAIIRKYIKLRPLIVGHNRFFINFQKGKCTPQPIGRNKFLSTPKQIANFLNLEDAENYTGHSFRRSSATLLANSGADLLTLKRHGGWRSSSVVEGYIDESISNKRKIGYLITDQISSKKHAALTESIEFSAPTSGTSMLLRSDSAPTTSTF